MISRFEDLYCRKEARDLVKMIYKITDKKTFSKDYWLKDQIRRASVSVMSNIAEWFERYSNKEFIRFLFIAKWSCGEVRSQLYIALDQKYLEQSEFDEVFDKCDKTIKFISNFMKTVPQ